MWVAATLLILRMILKWSTFMHVSLRGGMFSVLWDIHSSHMEWHLTFFRTCLMVLSSRCIILQSHQQVSPGLVHCVVAGCFVVFFFLWQSHYWEWCLISCGFESLKFVKQIVITSETMYSCALQSCAAFVFLWLVIPGNTTGIVYDSHGKTVASMDQYV